MADNVTLSAGTADGAVFKTDDDGTAHWPYTKLAFGPDNTQTIVGTGNPLPIDITTATIDVMLGSDFSDVLGSSNLVATDGSSALTIGVQSMGTDGTNAQIISTNTSGHVNIADGGNIITVDGTVTANPASGTIDTVSTVTNLSQMGGVAISLNTGVRDTGTQRVTIATDDSLAVTNAGTFAVQSTLQTGSNAIGKLAANSGVDIGDVDILSVIPGSGATNLGKAEDAAHTTGDVGVMALSVRTNTATSRAGTDGDYQPLITDTNGRLHVKLPNNEPVNIAQMNGVTTSMGNGVSGTGVQRVTLASDSTGQVTLATGSNLACNVGISGARTSGGTTLYKNIDVDESEDAVKASAGQIYWIHAMNLSAAVLYLKIYNATVASVVVGTTVPDLTFPIPTQGDTNGAGFVLAIPNGIAFSTAITIAATTGIADADTGAPGANTVVVNMGYA